MTPVSFLQDVTVIMLVVYLLLSMRPESTTAQEDHPTPSSTDQGPRRPPGGRNYIAPPTATRNHGHTSQPQPDSARPNFLRVPEIRRPASPPPVPTPQVLFENEEQYESWLTVMHETKATMSQEQRLQRAAESVQYTREEIDSPSFGPSFNLNSEADRQRRLEEWERRGVSEEFIERMTSEIAPVPALAVTPSTEALQTITQGEQAVAMEEPRAPRYVRMPWRSDRVLTEAESRQRGVEFFQYLRSEIDYPTHGGPFNPRGLTPDQDRERRIAEWRRAGFSEITIEELTSRPAPVPALAVTQPTDGPQVNVEVHDSLPVQFAEPRTRARRRVVPRQATMPAAQVQYEAPQSGTAPNDTIEDEDHINMAPTVYWY